MFIQVVEEDIFEIYQTKSLSNKLYLKRCLYYLKLKDGDSIVDHLNTFNFIINQLAWVVVKIEEDYNYILLLYYSL